MITPLLLLEVLCGELCLQYKHMNNCTIEDNDSMTNDEKAIAVADNDEVKGKCHCCCTMPN